MKKILELTQALAAEIAAIETVDEKIDTLNEVRRLLHEVSPMKAHPVDWVCWERSENVEANEYNPNKVAPIMMAKIIEVVFTASSMMGTRSRRVSVL